MLCFQNKNKKKSTVQGRGVFNKLIDRLPIELHLPGSSLHFNINLDI